MHTHTLSKAPNPETKKKSGTTPFFQAKLTVNTPGDAYEREADQVADQVMRMQEDEEPVVQRKSLTPVSSVQRMCADCEEKQAGKVQRQETASSSGGQTAPPVVGQVLSSGGGRPMDKGTRQFMEQRFGQDFGQVRIHTGGQAAESAAAIQAKAYTSGKDIVFGVGEYRPESGEGKRLLAHELVHVGQQGEGRRYIQRGCANGKWEFEYDGCSDPTEITKYTKAIGLFDKDDPAGGGEATQFGSRTRENEGRPCDLHDYCYQTCDKSEGAQKRCDDNMFKNMLKVCTASKTQNIKQNCVKWAGLYYLILNKYGSTAFNDRQKEVCSCNK